jgi:squalene monooxygenase
VLNLRAAACHRPIAPVSDILVAGAGPGGCAVALSLAQTGRRVTLVEPGRSPDRGLAGEWLHPAGVTSLRQLGVSLDGADFIENYGFVLHPGPGQAPVPLPYPHGAAVSMRHHVLVDRLRQAAAGDPGITLMLGERVIEAQANGPVTTTAGTFPADMLVGADGRASLIRRALRPGEPPAATLSTTAGVELTGAKLPVEGYGHIFLGGPGSGLAYRIGPDTIRLCLEVPPCRMPLPEMLRYLRSHYAPALPEDLRAAFLESVGCQPRVRWAANRFRRRLFYGHGRCALVGDAVGFGHPLAAHGMTMAILDAECLVRRGDITSYTRERRARSWAS